MPVPLGSRALDVLFALVERHRELLTQQELMDAVWAGVAVEDSNLAVQIFSLRRVLDEGHSGGSRIQTVIGRGYRFLPEVTQQADGPPPEFDSPSSSFGPAADASAGPACAVTGQAAVSPARLRARMPSRIALSAVLLVAVAGFGSIVLTARGIPRVEPTLPISTPRLSLVVLPFQNLSGDPNEDYLVNGVTEDLTTGVSHIPEAFVIASASARTYAGQSVDVRHIGRELGVRYVIQGSARRAGNALRVNVQLISTESRVQVWSDRFDELITDLPAGQDAILARMRGTLGVTLIEIETARRRRAQSTSPDAFDLVLRARTLRNQPENWQRAGEALALYEHALRLDPSSVLALTGAAAMLLERRSRTDWSTRRRLEYLVTRARELAPASEEVLGVQAAWLFEEKGAERRCPRAASCSRPIPTPDLAMPC